MSEQDFDICIIGAGVAGSAMAAYLADNGYHVAVVERDWTEQDRIVGELMQPGGVNQLTAMGHPEFFEGYDAQEVQGYALYYQGQTIQIPYPEGKRGKGFHNGKFIQCMRTYLQGHTAITCITGNVVALNRDSEKVVGVKYLPKGSSHSSEITARLTVVCDGMFSSFREQLSDNPKTITSYFLGLIMRDCTLPYPHHGHVIIADPSPVLAYPISSTETRVLIDFRTEQPPRRGDDLSTYLREVIAPQMPIEIRPAFHTAIAEGKFKVMPNHHTPASPKSVNGVVLLGDSLNMRHPLTGGGMTVALTDVHHLGKLLIENKSLFTSGEVMALTQQFYDTRHEANSTVNILADALYGVMNDEDLKEACYHYLQQGGKYASEPISLLSGVSCDRTMLLKHFFAVALQGAKDIYTSPKPDKIARSYRMIKSAVKIVSPLVLNEKPGPIAKTTFTIAKKVF